MSDFRDALRRSVGCCLLAATAVAPHAQARAEGVSNRWYGSYISIPTEIKTPHPIAVNDRGDVTGYGQVKGTSRVWIYVKRLNELFLPQMPYRTNSVTPTSISHTDVVTTVAYDYKNRSHPYIAVLTRAKGEYSFAWRDLPGPYPGRRPFAVLANVATDGAVGGSTYMRSPQYAAAWTYSGPADSPPTKLSDWRLILNPIPSGYVRAGGNWLAANRHFEAGYGIDGSGNVHPVIWDDRAVTSTNPAPEIVQSLPSPPSQSARNASSLSDSQALYFWNQGGTKESPMCMEVGEWEADDVPQDVWFGETGCFSSSVSGGVFLSGDTVTSAIPIRPGNSILAAGFSNATYKPILTIVDTVKATITTIDDGRDIRGVGSRPKFIQLAVGPRQTLCGLVRTRTGRHIFVAVKP
jgi:hypothetical protein